MTISLLYGQTNNEDIKEDIKIEARYKLADLLGIDSHSHTIHPDLLPFAGKDVTAGAENEIQVVVTGDRSDVDLPLIIEHSSYFKNIKRRTLSGDNPKHIAENLEEFLENNPSGVWENSWVRFPHKRLTSYSREILQRDLLSDRSNPNSPARNDLKRFFIEEGETLVRIPVSYMLKLSLANAISASSSVHRLIHVTGERLMGHYLNDNTSPETFSFHTVGRGLGRTAGENLARETLKRYILTQALAEYANRNLGLESSGQKVQVYFASHPHMRQKQLNNLTSDAYYRELFMSPCLSGWSKGEEKFKYMNLCHKVLSRSRMNAINKLKDAGIITSNLIVLPNISDISLANNGTHISLGSRKISEIMNAGESGFSHKDEKHTGDLAIKIFEHFLPLFINSYSATPYRIDFKDFHPETVLGFLPHEIDYTHLRMIWRRWKKKAGLKIMGQPVTPFGPVLLDNVLSRIFGLKGDMVPDFRLIDYPAALMSTAESPALSGEPGNMEELKHDLAELGIFDSRMPLYMFYRQRIFSEMGFAGFEGRFYSTFINITGDMGQAADLQAFFNALAYKYILSGEITHSDIPDTPFTESERRQIIFGAAIDLPTFYIKQNTKNLLFRKILPLTDNTRSSRRYPGFIRVPQTDYKRAIIRLIRKDGMDLVEAMGMEHIIRDLEHRIENSRDAAVSGRLVRGILDKAGVKDPMSLSAEEFNTAAEAYYRTELRHQHITESISVLEEDFSKLDIWSTYRDASCRDALRAISEKETASGFLSRVKNDMISDQMKEEDLAQLIQLIILSVHLDIRQFDVSSKESLNESPSSIHKQNHRGGSNRNALF